MQKRKHKKAAQRLIFLCAALITPWLVEEVDVPTVDGIKADLGAEVCAIVDIDIPSGGGDGGDTADDGGGCGKTFGVGGQGGERVEYVARRLILATACVDVRCMH